MEIYLYAMQKCHWGNATPKTSNIRFLKVKTASRYIVHAQ